MMDIIKTRFGATPEGREVSKYTLKNDMGMEVDIITYGATISSIRMPDRNKEPGDIVLGFDNFEDYLGDHPYFGAMIGRVCNRLGKARIEVEGRIHHLVANEGANHLHGGQQGFDKKLWTAQREKKEDRISLKMACVSPDGEEGYPGELLCEVEYYLNNDNELGIVCRAKTDKPTHVNLTNHSYFNLNNCKGDVLAHDLIIHATEVCELDKESIPTGKMIPVEGSPYDFRTAKDIASDIGDVAPGFDINYAVDKEEGVLDKVAAVFDPASGRSMEVLSTLPGVQLYTANHVDNIKGKDGLVYGKHSAICLETQYYPDAANHPQFPSTLLQPGEVFNEVTIYRFSW